MAYIFDLVDTWASGGGPYTSIKMNATDNDSGSASLLMDLQVGAASKFSVDKKGYINLGSNGGLFLFGDAANNISFGKSTDYLRLANNKLYIFLGSTGVGQVRNTGFVVANSGSFSFANAGYDDVTDTFLTRRAAANLRLGADDAAAPVAQTLSVQSVVAGTSNTAGANLTITGSQGTGTGAGGSIIFQVAPLGSSGSAQNALATALTIDSTKQATFGSTVIVGDTGFLALGSSAYGYISGGSGIGNFSVRGAAWEVFSQELRVAGTTSASFLGFSTGTGVAGDTRLYRDATNTLALRNGTAAQTFNIYNTYTSSTSFERYSVDWITTANLVIVGPNKGSSGGTQRVQRLSYLEDGGAGSTVPLLGSTCPAASGTVKSWIKVITSDGTTAYVPCWA